MKKINQLMAFALAAQSAFEINNKEWQERIKDEWIASEKYPRKKKKKVRKSLLLDWSIANWNPMQL